MPTLLLSETDVQQLLDMPLAVEAVEEGLRGMAEGTCVLHGRRRFSLPGGAFLHYMAAADLGNGVAGLKVYTFAGGRLRFLVLLYGTETGELLALVEAGFLSAVRTGAASGVATRYMARPDARTVGLIGTGKMAPAQLEAIVAVRPIEQVRVYSRREERRRQFAETMTARLGVPVRAVSSAEEAVRGADIVVTATTAAQPVVEGRWLAPGTHINAIGSNFAHRREVDAETVLRAGVIATDSIEQARYEAGDLIQVFAGDPEGWARVVELSQIVAGLIPGRRSREEWTLFKSNGIAIEDVAVAARVYARAREQGRGTALNLWVADGA